MRDKENRQVAISPDRLELVVQQVACHRVQRTEGLVHQQHGSRGREGARDGHALPHATGQLVRAAIGEVGQVNGREILTRLCLSVPLANALEPQGSCHVVQGGQPREQCVVLEHEGGVPFDLDRAGGGLIEAADEVEQGGLAAAGSPHQGEELPRLGLQSDAVQSEHSVLTGIPLGHTIEGYCRAGDRGSFVLQHCSG